LVSKVGMRRPFHCTSLGKAIAANIGEERIREKLFNNISFDDARTPKSITNVTRLRRELSIIKKRGFALDEGEAVTGIRCLGAAILGADGKAIAALSVSGPMVRVTKDRLPFFATQLREAVREISNHVGYSDPATATPMGKMTGSAKRPPSSKDVEIRVMQKRSQEQN